MPVLFRHLGVAVAAVAVAGVLSACGSNATGCEGDAADEFERLDELPVLEDLPDGVSAVERGGGCDPDDPDIPVASRTFTSAAAAAELLPHFVKVAKDAGWEIEQLEPLDDRGGGPPLTAGPTAPAGGVSLLCSSRSLGDFTALLSLDRVGHEEYVWQASTAPGFARGSC
ncbi:hypothetical protein [Motilibacter aurantiacus]|uniref:hypothetical protein n=1 Tax=Motilibacter aurantiacus TaxID=2714955 RepID=UPI00140D7A48|nr:hypothetical protein [Motilibacter aurantiacus]NHC47624.1 hypothetical protein [Motilibacter aurantiacus]